jgi:hypothetical protein
VFLSLCVLGQAAWAEPEQEPRWIPSIEFGFDYLAYTAAASVENHLNPPAQEDTQTNPSNWFTLQLGGELMGPAFEAVPGRPRLFVRGGVGLKPFSDDVIFELGDIDGSAEEDIAGFQRRLEQEIGRRCEDNIPSDCSTADPGDFEGQGSRIEANLLSPSWYAALGVAFNVPVANSLLLQLKPSVAYSGEKIDLVGQMTTVTEPSPEIFEIYRSTADTSITDHSLGAGLELALALFRSATPVRTSLYVDVRFLWLLSDPTTTFGDSLGLASYTVDREKFGIRGGAGVRFSWMGFAGN